MKTRKHTDETDADSGKNKPLINKRQAFHLLPYPSVSFTANSR